MSITLSALLPATHPTSRRSPSSHLGTSRFPTRVPFLLELRTVDCIITYPIILCSLPLRKIYTPPCTSDTLVLGYLIWYKSSFIPHRSQNPISFSGGPHPKTDYQQHLDDRKVPDICIRVSQSVISLERVSQVPERDRHRHDTGAFG